MTQNDDWPETGILKTIAIGVIFGASMGFGYFFASEILQLIAWVLYG